MHAPMFPQDRFHRNNKSSRQISTRASRASQDRCIIISFLLPHSSTQRPNVQGQKSGQHLTEYQSLRITTTAARKRIVVVAAEIMQYVQIALMRKSWTPTK
jgi:hypothetical protein